MSPGYFIIRSGEGGTSIGGPFSSAELLKRITPDKNGDSYYGSDLKFLDHVPQSDQGYWIGDEENPMLIIKGEIVVPKPKAVVTEFEV